MFTVQIHMEYHFKGMPKVVGGIPASYNEPTIQEEV